MAMDIKNKDTYVINSESGIGDIKVSAEVVMAIAAVAATEVKGVYAMQGNTRNDIVTMLGFKDLSKGVKIEIKEDETVKVMLAIILEYGYGIPSVSAQIQEKVKTAIETMTGLLVESVNVRIAGVNIDKAE